ncbi:MAG: hypothetical protein J2P19_30565 [Pseudonocardia sp.]|nr:hypothetical protein [Pseudonocardia sp.]
MNGTFRRKAAVASLVPVLGVVGSVLFGGTAFADDSHGPHERDGGVGKPQGTAHATCVGPPLAVGVAVVGQNSGETTQCSVKKDPPPADDAAHDGS